MIPEKLTNWNVQDASPNDLPGLKAERRLARSNRVRLEVGVFHGRQLFAWPGANEFKYEAFDELAGGGAASSGEFGPFSASVFLSDADPASFQFIGFQTVEGARVAAYEYEVPQGLRRLIVQITKPPSDSGGLSGRIVTDYGRRKVSEIVALLPVRSLLHLLFSDDGNLAVNETDYGACKLFGAESTLDFGLNAESAATKRATEETPEVSQIPEGLELTSKVMTPVDVRRSYAGDLIEAEVAEPLKAGGKVLIPKGATLTGRLVQVERRYYPNKEASVRIQFDRVTFEGASMPIALGSVGPVPSAIRRIDPTSGVAKVATIMRVGSDDFHVGPHSLWCWITK